MLAEQRNRGSELLKRDGLGFWRGLMNALGLELIAVAVILIGWLVMR